MKLTLDGLNGFINVVEDYYSVRPMSSITLPHLFYKELLSDAISKGMTNYHTNMYSFNLHSMSSNSVLVKYHDKNCINYDHLHDFPHCFIKEFIKQYK